MSTVAPLSTSLALALTVDALARGDLDVALPGADLDAPVAGERELALRGTDHDVGVGADGHRVALGVDDDAVLAALVEDLDALLALRCRSAG